ncbi:alpha/beta fold hydrolase [Hymenobacter sp. YC55]|uniref:alpha/beta fold hydrolase n=1 Tax=Hymenobacter sp. YC55 TaxID=3034019 RepID=UPI0023F84AFF|nr:alpha/beta fold hydrolase [Hymenobacter sp. YC55]MDF7812936.1 alpha/beta fold hydrolase [Hymenobacter sp. YC55]
MHLHHTRHGSGKPLLLIHGIGGSSHSWNTILDELATHREVITIDLPGHGQTPPLPGSNSFYALVDAVADWLRAQHLEGIACVGSSMGARLVLELARRGVVGAVVALDPGGFWRGWQIPVFYYSVGGSVRLLRAVEPILPALTASTVGRTLLLAQFSARPWRVPASVALTELRSFVHTPIFDELLHDLAYGKKQEGASRGSIRHPLVIGWGRQDRVCFPSQARRAAAAFPDATLYWFDHCGHFPHWDQPTETVQLILSVTGRETATSAASVPAHHAAE